jgi:hypothetical protein
LWFFRTVTESVFTHKTTVTGGGPDCRRLEQFRAVNTLLGNLKTAFSGTYHAFDFSEYAHRYLAEFRYRFNRRFDLSTTLTRLLRESSITLPHPGHVIRAGQAL